MKHYFILILLFLSSFLFAQSTEMRGVWVSTVQRVDFPSQLTTNPETLKKEWLKMLAFFKSVNLNAVIVQVRPTADAIYPSQLVPFSKFITGTQGKGLDKGFDLLKFMVESSHQNGMEFHAWINPYRAIIDGDTVNIAKNHVFKKNRSWLMKYGKEYLLNPGIPEVREHLKDVVSEIVQNYDVDAIHFDDYFYPYRIVGETLSDSLTFEKYGKEEFDNINDWRRNNTDLMIQDVRTAAKAINPRVQIGVSPFAIWRNKTSDPNGSDTQAGQQCYDDLFSDVLKWVQNDWVDYIAPEIYFHIGFPIADYEKILDWWVKNANGKALYVAHALYKVNGTKYPEWSEPDQISRQIQLNRQYPEVSGSLFFSATTLLKNELGVTDSLRQNFYQQPAQLPDVLMNNDDRNEYEAIETLPIRKRTPPKEKGYKIIKKSKKR